MHWDNIRFWIKLLKIATMMLSWWIFQTIYSFTMKTNKMNHCLKRFNFWIWIDFIFKKVYSYFLLSIRSQAALSFKKINWSTIHFFRRVIQSFRSTSLRWTVCFMTFFLFQFSLLRPRLIMISFIAISNSSNKNHVISFK